METTHTPAPTISPVTAALLAALRTYEQAVDNYYCAVSELRATSPDTWPELKPEEQSAFEAGRAVIYGKIQERPPARQLPPTPQRPQGASREPRRRRIEGRTDTNPAAPEIVPAGAFSIPR